jgi:UDP-N-acetylmuramoylalanine-D-glutamate ligase
LNKKYQIHRKFKTRDNEEKQRKMRAQTEKELKRREKTIKQNQTERIERFKRESERIIKSPGINITQNEVKLDFISHDVIIY